MRHTPSEEGVRTGTLAVRVGDVDRTVELRGYGIGGHTGWAVWNEANAYGGGGAYADDPTTSVLAVGGTPGFLEVELVSKDWNRSRSLTFRGGCGDAIRAGSGRCYGVEMPGVGYVDAVVDVHEAEVVDDRVTRLSLTYRYYAYNYAGAQYGSIAWRATAPRQPLPGVAGTNPDPVRGLSASAGYSDVTLSWTAPLAPDWSEVQVWLKPGTTAPKTAGESGSYLVYSGRGTEAYYPGLHPNGAYAFAAFVKDSEGRWSTRATAVVRANKLTLKASKKSAVYGDTVTLQGTFAGMGHSYVDIAARRPGTDVWYLVETVSTASDGSFYAYHQPAFTYDYYAFFNGSGTKMGASSAPVRVTVAKDVVAWSEKSTGRLGTTFTIVAGVNPVATGKTITLERWVDGKWRAVKSAKTNGTKPTYFSVKPTSRGTHTYRVTTGSGGGLAPGKSVSMRLKTT
ncbi:MAG: hypothetical protein ACT4QG_12150 [Sporichthyaceae bacterium]